MPGKIRIGKLDFNCPGGYGQLYTGGRRPGIELLSLTLSFLMPLLVAIQTDLHGSHLVQSECIEPPNRASFIEPFPVIIF